MTLQPIETYIEGIECKSIDLFYIHGAGEGGYPEDIREWVSRFQVASSSIHCVGGDTALPYVNVNKTFWSLLVKFCTAQVPKPRTVTILIGGLIWQNFLLAMAFKLKGLKYAIMPLSQFASYAATKKLFHALPIISNGEVAAAQGAFARLKSFFAPIYKLIYLHTAASLIVRFADIVIVASEFEKNEVLARFSADRKNFYSYGFDFIIKNGRPQEYRYDSKYFNMTYWGRVDLEPKGLDRIVHTIARFKNDFSSRNFRFHFIGPSYNGGKARLSRLVDSLGVSDLCNIPADEGIRKIDFGGLTTADGLLFLTRWEGFPRVVREAVEYEIPILVSPESHFCDVHWKKNIVRIEDPDSLEQIHDALISLQDARYWNDA